MVCPRSKRLQCRRVYPAVEKPLCLLSPVRDVLVLYSQPQARQRRPSQVGPDVVPGSLGRHLPVASSCPGLGGIRTSSPMQGVASGPPPSQFENVTCSQTLHGSGMKTPQVFWPFCRSIRSRPGSEVTTKDHSGSGVQWRPNRASLGRQWGGDLEGVRRSCTWAPRVVHFRGPLARTARGAREEDQCPARGEPLIILRTGTTPRPPKVEVFQTATQPLALDHISRPVGHPAFADVPLVGGTHPH